MDGGRRSLGTRTRFARLVRVLYGWPSAAGGRTPADQTGDHRDGNQVGEHSQDLSGNWNVVRLQVECQVRRNPEQDGADTAPEGRQRPKISAANAT